MKLYWLILILFSINASIASTHGQTIYQYKNQYNVTEFTDVLDTEKTLIKEFEINRTTLEQQEIINKKLTKIRAYNKDFNKRYYDEKKRQYETAKKNAEARKQAKKRADADHYRAVSKLSRGKFQRHQRKDAIRKKLGKKGHSKYRLKKLENNPPVQINQ